MYTTEILALLRVDKNSGTPLRIQLEKHLETLLNRLEPGSLLPPERVMAENLSISRVTIRNAMQKFYEQGKIVRHGRLGTMVAQTNEQNKLKAYNPMAFGIGWESAPDYSLKFLLYENLPPQKKFWTETVESFNAKNPDCPVEIVWMTSNSDASHIQELLEEKSIDILLDSPLFELDKKKKYHHLSESFQKQLSPDEYLVRMFPEMPEYSLPISIETPMLFRNCELTERCGIKNISHALREGKLAELSAQASLKLPDDTFACGRIWDYFSYTALPEAMDSPEQIRRILNGIAAAGKKGKYSEHLFMTAQKSIMEHVELFLRGKVLFLPVPMTFLQAFDEPSFAYEAIPFPKKRGEKLLSYYDNLAITKNCLNTNVAEQFLLHVVSPEVQEQCAAIKKELPVRRTECRDMLFSAYGYNDQEAKEFLNSLQFYSHEKDTALPLFSRFCTYFVRDELVEVFRGELNPEEATQLITSKWQRFRRNTNQKQGKDAK